MVLIELCRIEIPCRPVQSGTESVLIELCRIEMHI